MADSEAEESPDKIAGKWLYLLLFWIYENRDVYEDPFQVVEQVYAEFSYPRSMEPFVRYMPSNEPTVRERREKYGSPL